MLNPKPNALNHEPKAQHSNGDLPKQEALSATIPASTVDALMDSTGVRGRLL